jgi:decaprenyl-phosphate phosphoribosyltransferase
MPTATPQPRTRPSTRASAEATGARRQPVAELRRRRPAGGIRAWLRAARVGQWAKNLLLFGAPLAAGALGRPGVLLRVSVAFVAFCLLASGAYLINDVRDASGDRRHPVKRHRPIASGVLSARRAFVVGVAAVLLGVAVALTLGRGLFAAACAYALLNFGYTAWLRRIAIIDIGAIAGAFALRAAAGAVAADVPISRWFLVDVSFVALFVAAGKRYADFLDPAARRSRPVLDGYNADFLRIMLTVASSVALGAYCLWAFGASRPGALPWRELTVVPFTTAMLRYGLLVTGGVGDAPEEILFADRFMQLAGAAWLVRSRLERKPT